jgi:hypothetical protein
MVRMYQTTHKSMAWYLPIRVHPIPNSSSSESVVESDGEINLKWTPEPSKVELEVSSEAVDPGIPKVEMSEQGDGESEAQSLESFSTLEIDP